MASGEVYTAVRDYLSASWTSSPIAWENEDFDKPNAPWVMFEMSGDLYAQMSVGAWQGTQNRYDQEGVMYLHVFVPVGTGSLIARQHAKTLADLFRGALLMSDSLEFLDASIGMGQVGDDEGLFYRITVSVDWRLIGD